MITLKNKTDNNNNNDNHLTTVALYKPVKLPFTTMSILTHVKYSTTDKELDHMMQRRLFDARYL